MPESAPKAAALRRPPPEEEEKHLGRPGVCFSRASQGPPGPAVPHGDPGKWQSHISLRAPADDFSRPEVLDHPSAGEPQALCAATNLLESGKAVVFDVLLWGQPTRAFALRFKGALVAYINRCAHVPVEMDWQPGEFLDHDRRWIVCTLHGATYEPADGRCNGGPCGRGKLMPVQISERDGQAYWYPSPNIRPPDIRLPVLDKPVVDDRVLAKPPASESLP